jgi:hypothetical protein
VWLAFARRILNSISEVGGEGVTLCRDVGSEAADERWAGAKINGEGSENDAVCEAESSLFWAFMST